MIAIEPPMKKAVLAYLKEYLEQVSSKLKKQQRIRFENTATQRDGYHKVKIKAKKDSFINKLPEPTYFEDDFHLDKSQEQMLTTENVLLQRELDCLVDQVKVVEGQVVVLQEAQQILAKHVMEQKETIEEIKTTVIDARGNVKKGNVQLRKASDRGVGFRIMVMMFLISLSFTLLFLNWYS